MVRSVEKQLDALLKLQSADCGLDRMAELRGALPEEVGEMESGLERSRTCLQSIQEELSELEQVIVSQRSSMKEAESLVKKYEVQQMNVRNNREYSAITREIELQKLEIQLSEKRIKDAYEAIESKKLELEQNEAAIEKTRQVLTSKQKLLEGLIRENEEEENKLREQRAELLKNIDDVSLQLLYEQIRASVHNKLAVVVVDRDACGGCFNRIPPQKQIDIKERSSVTTCEHCGRIVADVKNPLTAG